MWRLFIAVIATCLTCGAAAHGAVATLVYEIETPKKSAETPININLVVAVVECRLRELKVENVEVKPRRYDRLSIEFAQANQKSIDCVKESLEHPGHLEFRILADNRDPEQAKIIELATASPKGKEVVDVSDGKKVVAEWVRMPKKKIYLSAVDSVQRTTDGGNHEVLALIDPWNVTGQYLKNAVVAKGIKGPQIDLEFNADGAKCFEHLTSENLPKAGGRYMNLGIILDRQLLTAATIAARISGKGEITGDFTKAELADIVAILLSGELPAKFRLVTDAPPDHK